MCILPNFAYHDLKEDAPKRKMGKKAKRQNLKMIVAEYPPNTEELKSPFFSGFSETI